MYHSLPVHVQEFFFLVCTCVQKVIFTGSTFGKLLSSPDITFFKLPKMFVQACTISAELKPQCVFFCVLCTYQVYTINYLMISSCIIKQCSPYLLELNFIEYLNTKMHPASTVIFENKYVQKIAQEKIPPFFLVKRHFYVLVSRNYSQVRQYIYKFRLSLAVFLELHSIVPYVCECCFASLTSIFQLC